MNETESVHFQQVIIEVLCSQALADHLGDVRNAERKLWKLLDVPELSYDDPAYDSDSVFTVTHARLKAAGYSLPEWLRGEDDD